MVYVSEEITTAYAAQKQFPLIPCGCSQRTGTVRRSLRDYLGELKQDHPRVLENILSAMGKLDTSRLLDTRFLALDGDTVETGEPDLLPILSPAGE